MFTWAFFNWTFSCCRSKLMKERWRGCALNAGRCQHIDRSIVSPLHHQIQGSLHRSHNGSHVLFCSCSGRGRLCSLFSFWRFKKKRKSDQCFALRPAWNVHAIAFAFACAATKSLCILSCFTCGKLFWLTSTPDDLLAARIGDLGCIKNVCSLGESGFGVVF